MHRSDSMMDGVDFSRNHRPKPPKNGLDVTVLGVCTGSDLEGIDCALLRYRQDAPNASLRMELLKYGETLVAPAERIALLNVLREAYTKPSAVPRLNVLIGHMFATSIKTFCNSRKIDRASIDLLGTHIPTLRTHRPLESGNPTTHPSGWNMIVSAETGITTVFDFAIIEGASPGPHVSPTAYIDKLLLRHPTKFRACLDIGELASLSFIPPLVDGNARGTISRVCGPGSLLIDYAMRYCTSNNHAEDHNGKYAAPGKVNQDLVDRFLSSHNYLRSLPPLVIAREMFGDHEAQRLIDECLFLNMSETDTMATVTRVTAQNIWKQYHRLLFMFFPQGQKVDELFICGPSARNSNIIDYLKAELPENIITKPLDDIGISGDANEAVSYAHLALEAVLGQVTSKPSGPVTPAPNQPDHDAVRGKILRGQRWEWLLARIQQFSEGKQLFVTHDVRSAGNLESAIKTLGLR